MKTPELLLPAGNLEKMQMAYAFGADAVYAGQPRYSLRARNNDFKLPVLLQGMATARQLGKKLFITSNLLPHNDKVRTYIRDITPIMENRPDALIMADPGLIAMVLETWPDAVIHLSVQANTLNSAAVKFWQKNGVKRIILSRELSLDEVERIRQDCPDIELEVFVHGALCIAYSGRCLLSGYFNHRDSNQGTCTNSCRWDYKTLPAQEGEAGEISPIHFTPQKLTGISMATINHQQSACGHTERHPAADAVYLLEEGKRQGEENLLPIMEDEHGTYIMNSKDLRAVEHVARLVKIGVDSLKIEGRTKSAYYVARTAQVYRHAIDDAVAGRAFNPELIYQLDGLANRGYTSGFFQRHKSHDTQNYTTNSSESAISRFVGKVIEYKVEDGQGLGLIEVKNRFAVGDEIEIIHPSGNHREKLTLMKNENGHNIECAPGDPYRVWIPLNEQHQGALIARMTTLA